MSVILRQSATAAATSVAYSSPVQAGNLLVYFIGGCLATVNVASDTLNNTWIKAGSWFTNAQISIFYCIANASGPTTVTSAGASSGATIVWEFSRDHGTPLTMGAQGLELGSVVHAAATNANPGTGASIEPYNDSLIVACVTSNSPRTLPTPNAPWVNIQASGPVYAATQIMTSVSSQTAQFTTVASAGWDASTVVFGFPRVNAPNALLPRRKPFLA